MYPLKSICFCVFFSLIGNNVHCEDSENKAFIDASVKFIHINSWEEIVTDVTARNLRDVIPKKVKTWDTFQIYIHETNVPILKNECISDIKNLTTITLWFGDISEVEPGALKNLPQLEELSISYNKLTEIKTSTFAHLTISELNLNNNSISVLHPGAFRQLPNLKKLDLNGNKICALPLHLFIDILNIQVLKVNSNQLTQFNCSIPNLPKLQHLLLSDNLISKLDSICFNHLPRLQFLSLTYNQLREIPKGILNHTKIEELYLEFNQISAIASNAFDIPTLRVLGMAFNKLKVWDSRWMLFTPKLEFLSVRGNQIEEIPDKAVKYGKYFDFSRNQIKTISGDAFRNLNHINYLLLSKNKIESWDVNLLKNITVFVMIDLCDNQLQCVDGNLEEAFGGARCVMLTENQWREDCRLKIRQFQRHHDRC